MSKLKLLDDKTIEEVIDYIIETYHDPLPEMTDDLNKKGRVFFYGYNNVDELKPLREMFFKCTSDLFDHINEEEDEQFVLLKNKINNPKLEVNMNIISKINGDHHMFDNVFFELEKRFNNINISEDNSSYKDYQNLLKSFSYYHNETVKHIKIETDLLEDFLQIMEENGVEVIL